MVRVSSFPLHFTLEMIRSRALSRTVKNKGFPSHLELKRKLSLSLIVLCAAPMENSSKPSLTFFFLREIDMRSSATTISSWVLRTRRPILFFVFLFSCFSVAPSERGKNRNSFPINPLPANGPCVAQQEKAIARTLFSAAIKRDRQVNFKHQPPTSRKLKIKLCV